MVSYDGPRANNAPIPAERVDDRWERTLPRLSLGRDQERAPMLWETGVHAGFCPPEVEPWLPVGQEGQQSSVAEQLTDPSSMLSLTRWLLTVRRTHHALVAGSYRPVMTGGEDCFVSLRQHGWQRLLIALNFACAERALDLSAFGRGRIVLSSHLDREGEIDLAQVILRADKGCLILTGPCM